MPAATPSSALYGSQRTATTLQATVTASAAKIAASATPFEHIVFQNNGANPMWIGDSTITTSKGIKLAAGGVPVYIPGLRGDLSLLYVIGTLNDKLDILYFQ